MPEAAVDDGKICWGRLTVKGKRVLLLLEKGLCELCADCWGRE